MTTGVIVLIIVVIVIIVVLGAFLAQRRRTQQLQNQFGSEYQRTVARAGGQRDAESDLAARQKRRRDLNIVELDPEAQARYRDMWRTTQGKFVDDPATATREADVLVARVMRDRGYPVDDFDQQASDISVDHPQVAENYRSAHALFQAHEKGLAGTDDLRQAFVHYRSLFAQLLEVDGDGHREATR